MRSRRPVGRRVVLATAGSSPETASRRAAPPSPRASTNGPATESRRPVAAEPGPAAPSAPAIRQARTNRRRADVARAAVGGARARRGTEASSVGERDAPGSFGAGLRPLAPRGAVPARPGLAPGGALQRAAKPRRAVAVEFAGRADAAPRRPAGARRPVAVEARPAVPAEAAVGQARRDRARADVSRAAIPPVSARGGAEPVAARKGHAGRPHGAGLGHAAARGAGATEPGRPARIAPLGGTAAGVAFDVVSAAVADRGARRQRRYRSREWLERRADRAVLGGRLARGAEDQHREQTQRRGSPVGMGATARALPRVLRVPRRPTARDHRHFASPETARGSPGCMRAASRNASAAARRSPSASSASPRASTTSSCPG